MAHFLGAIQILPGSLQWRWCLRKGSFLLWTREGEVLQVGGGCRLAHWVQALPLLKVICPPNSVSSKSFRWPPLISCFNLKASFFTLLSLEWRVRVGSFIILDVSVASFLLIQILRNFSNVLCTRLKVAFLPQTGNVFVLNVWWWQRLAHWAQLLPLLKVISLPNAIQSRSIAWSQLVVLSWQTPFIFSNLISLYCSNKEKIPGDC